MPADGLRNRDAFRGWGGGPGGGIGAGSQLSVMGGLLQFGKPGLCRRIPHDVGIRTVRPSSQALQLVGIFELSRPHRHIHVLIIGAGTTWG